MDDYTSARVKLTIRDEIMKSEDWTDCRLLDEVKRKLPECSSEDVEALYAEELRAKVASMAETELKGLLDDQCGLPLANRNGCLLTLVRARLG